MILFPAAIYGHANLNEYTHTVTPAGVAESKRTLICMAVLRGFEAANISGVGCAWAPTRSGHANGTIVSFGT